MKGKEMMKRLIELQKKTFYIGFSTMVMLQDQVERLMKDFADKIPGVSGEDKKGMAQWEDVFKRNRDSFVRAIEDGYGAVGRLIDLQIPEISFQEKMKETLSEFIPRDVKKSMEEMAAMHKKHRDEVRKYLDELFSWWEDSLPVLSKGHVQGGITRKKTSYNKSVKGKKRIKTK